MSPSYYTVFFFLFARKYPRNRERSTNTTIVIVEERDKQASRLVQYRENGVADTATNIRGKNKNKTCWLTRFAKQLSLSLSLSLTFHAAERSPFLHSWPSIPQDPKLEDKNRCWPPRENTGAALREITITCATELRGTTLCIPVLLGRKVKSGRIQSGRMTGWPAPEDTCDSPRDRPTAFPRKS